VEHVKIKIVTITNLAPKNAKNTPMRIVAIPKIHTFCFIVKITLKKFAFGHASGDSKINFVEFLFKLIEFSIHLKLVSVIF